MVFANVLGNLHENVLILSETKSEWFSDRTDGLESLIELQFYCGDTIPKSLKQAIVLSTESSSDKSPVSSFNSGFH